VTKFAFVAAERANHAVAMLCRVVGASVSGFYAWLRAIPSRQNRAEAEAELRGHISRIFAAKRRVYGAPRIHAELRREGHRHARRRIERLMRDMGLQAQRGRRRRPQTTDSRHDLPVAPNLLGRSFVAERPDAVWLADISYIPTDEGFLYLARISHAAWCIGASDRVKRVLRERVEPGWRGAPRCPHTVARPGWRSEERAGANSSLRSTAGA
jgi:transposase InsO family protein